MVYCAQAHLVFATEALRDARLAFAQNAINSRSRWGQTVVTAADSAFDPEELHYVPIWGINLTSRFTARQDMEQIETALLGLAGLQPGSWVQIHPCPHDESVYGACQVERRTVV